MPRRVPRKRQSGSLLNNARWLRLRDRVVREEPLCRLRLRCCTGRSQTADHIIPVSQRPDLRYLRSNLRGSCHPCNMRRKDRPLSEVRREEELVAPKAKPAAALEFFEPVGRTANLDFEDEDS